MKRIPILIIALLFPISAFASTPWDKGCAAPAPEVGAGVLGAVFCVAAVRFFRKKDR